MKLQPNIGSDRSWVWKVAADYAEVPPTSETLAIRFANSDSEYSRLQLRYHLIESFIDAAQFKDAFENAQKSNAELIASKPEESAAEVKTEEVKEEVKEEAKPEEPAAEEPKAEEEEKKEE